MGRNIRLYYFFRALSCAHMFKPFTYFFCMSRGLSVFEFMLLYTIFSSAVILLEVPTGAWADRLGRRKSMAFGALLMGFSSLGYLMAHGFAVFAVCEFFFAVGLTLTSGADSAFLYDTLKQGGREEEYRRLEGVGTSAKHIGLMLAAIIGGVLATIHLALPYVATAVVSFAAVFAAFAMSEARVWSGRAGSDGVLDAETRPTGKNATRPTRVFASFFRRFKALRMFMGEAFSIIHRKPALLWAILYSSMIFVIIRMSDALYQPLLKDYGFDFLAMGAVFGILNLVAAVSARNVNGLTRKLTEKGVLWALPVVLIVSYMLLDALGPFICVVLMMAQYSVTGVYSPFTKSIINHEIGTSHVRATVLSAESSVKRLVVAGVSPVLGWLISSYSLRAGLYACAGVGLLGTVAVLMVNRRRFTLGGSVGGPGKRGAKTGSGGPGDEESGNVPKPETAIGAEVIGPDVVTADFVSEIKV